MTYLTAQMPDALDRLVPRLTYKPGYRVEIERGGGSIAPRRLVVVAPVQDSADPTGATQTIVRHTFSVPSWPGDVTEKVVLDWVLHACVFAMEQHEAREWLRCDGEQVDPPGHGLDDPYR